MARALNANVSPPNRAFWLAIFLTLFVAATYGFGVYLFATIVVEIRHDLHFGYGTVGMITGSAQLGFLIFALGGSWITERIGGTQLTWLSLLLCGMSLLGLSLVQTAWQAGVLLTLLGGCSASVYVPIAEIVTKVVASNHRGKVLGLISSGTSYGVFANGLIAPVAIAFEGWRSVWVIVGAATCALALGSLFLFRSFELFERPALQQDDRPHGYSELLSNKSVLLLWLITFLNGVTLLPFQTYLVPILRDQYHFAFSASAHVWSMIGFCGMFSGFLVGVLADRFGVRRLLALAYLSAALGSLLIILHGALWTMFASAFLFAVAFYPIFGLVPAYMSKMLDPGSLTRVFGVANVTVGLGGVVGNLVGGLIRENFNSFTPVYVIVTLLLLLQVWPVLTLRNDVAKVGEKGLA